MTVLPRSLINDDGESFDGEIDGIEPILSALSSEDRVAYRNETAAAIATHDGSRMLIVAGPGTGKSYLFLRRIEHWLDGHDDLSIGVSSFVRKLVKDLESEVAANIPQADQSRVTVSTLHALARGIVERNKGTSAHKFRPHIKIIPPAWMNMVWADVLEFHHELKKGHTAAAFQKQFYEDEFLSDDGWPDLLGTFFRLRLLYNAVGFADMIVLAREAIEENSRLGQHDLWIIDEFQDFNKAEERLINAMTGEADAVLIAGDDDQALYQTLKASHPEIICSYYGDRGFAKAMLPYCSRCSYFVCKVASAFIARHREDGAIRKIYLPLKEDETATKVQVVGAAAPTSAVDYIEKFIERHQDDLKTHKAEMEAGEETDPFLLILTPIRDVRFYKLNGARERLESVIANWSAVPSRHSRDYWKVADYCAAGWDASDNFAVRKVLQHEEIKSSDIHPMIVEALERNCPLVEIADEAIREALAKCGAMVEIIESDTLGPSEKAEEAKKLVRIDDSERLEIELDEFPISRGGAGEGDEGDEAIETAGALSPVEMLTLVGAKGLSAKHVIVIGCDDLNMKQTSALTFFVALSRARGTLHLITSLKAGGANEPHPFVLELPDDCCEFLIHKKTSSPDRYANSQAFAQRVAQLAYGAQQGSRRR
jgi:ATP-dependent DNA helicase UvrD/PcrA